MKRSIIIMLAQQVAVWGCLLAMCTSARAQDEIKKYNNEYVYSAIVRSRTTQYSITYNEENNIGVFGQNDFNGNIRRKFQLTSGMHVNDFIIYGDNVYFCGKKNNNTAIIGWFHVSGAFDNGLPYYTICEVPLNIPSQYWYGGRDDLLEFTKIKVANCLNGLHLLMIGMGRDSVNGMCYDSLWCVADMYYDSINTQWSLYYSMDYASWFSYDDLIVTKNDVVVAGHKKIPGYGSGRDYNLLYYPLPDNINPYIFYAYSGGALSPYGFSVPVQSVPLSAFSASLQTPPDITMECLAGRAFATICYGKVRGAGYKAMVSIYDSPTVLNYRGYFIPQYMEGYREMVFNKMDSSISFLHVTPNPVMQWIKLGATGGIIPYVNTKTTSNWEWYSLDELSAKDHMVLAGTTASGEGTLADIVLTLNNNDCVSSSRDIVKEYPQTDVTWDVTHVVIFKEMTPIVYMSPLEVTTLNIECLQK